jgi:NAD(P)-dependent dehydrogenase (short-subunit alcohol dehydrogenase family)
MKRGVLTGTPKGPTSSSPLHLFTYELNQRLAQAGNTREIISVAVHPGYTATNLQAGKLPLWEYMNALFAMKGEHGALSQNEGNILIRLMFT